MKYINLFLTVTFVWFAYFQVNDPDSWLWIIIYLWIAAITGLAFKGVYYRLMLSVGLAACIVEACLLFPEVLAWVKQGMPSVTGSMKAETPYIEFAREFFGIIIVALTLLFIFLQWKKFPVKQ